MVPYLILNSAYELIRSGSWFPHVNTWMPQTHFHVPKSYFYANLLSSPWYITFWTLLCLQLSHTCCSRISFSAGCQHSSSLSTCLNSPPIASFHSFVFVVSIFSSMSWIALTQHIPHPALITAQFPSFCLDADLKH